MKNIVVVSGAGISAESGLKTFRDDGGLWRQHSLYDLATPDAWQRNPRLVLDFYNERRRLAFNAKPNDAHLALAQLEERYDVIVVTQNVDDLHERAGSSRVIHLHGEINKVRSTANDSLIYDVGERAVDMGDLCELSSQLRPHIVWFGEQVMRFDEAVDAVKGADKVVVVGTSLTVYPAASLLNYASQKSQKYLITKDVEAPPPNFVWRKGSASALLPELVSGWMRDY